MTCVFLFLNPQWIHAFLENDKNTLATTANEYHSIETMFSKIVFLEWKYIIPFYITIDQLGNGSIAKYIDIKSKKDSHISSSIQMEVIISRRCDFIL